jgi:predicted secreted hydrolase
MKRRIYGGVLAGIAALALLLGGCGLPGTISTSGSLPRASASPTPTPLAPVRFPQDEAPHHDLTEWWYYTGHLQGRDAAGHDHTYGFELVFFQTLRGAFSPYYAAHFAVSDITRGQFHFDQRAGFEPASVIPPAGSVGGFNVAQDDWLARGLNGHDQLAAGMDGYAIDLQLDGATPPVLHAGNGIITLGPAGFSYYYSRPRMRVAGTLMDHGQAVPVRGQAWMDHQWGNFIPVTGGGWDWFSLQLSDETDAMLYVIRDSNRQLISVVGTFVTADGMASSIPAADIRIQATGSWTSPATKGDYPSGWQVTIASQQLALRLTPLLLDQELVTTQSTGVAYWEGAVAIAGQARGHRISGEGYVELTGYAAPPSGTSSGGP